METQNSRKILAQAVHRQREIKGYAIIFALIMGVFSIAVAIATWLLAWPVCSLVSALLIWFMCLAWLFIIRWQSKALLDHYEQKYQSNGW